MNSSFKYKLFYYGTASAVSATMILLLLSWLSWPATAATAFGVTLFIHALILSRSAKDLFLAALEKGLIHELIYTAKSSAELPESKR